MIDPAELTDQQIFEVRASVGEYSFRLTNLRSALIRIKVYWTADEVGNDRFGYTISHLVRTPRQVDTYYQVRRSV